MCQCSSKSWLFSVLLNLVLVFSVTGFNVDSFNYAIFKGAETSMFGFSVAVHKESRSQAWVIVGAPEAQSVYQPTVHRGGAVYKCPVDRDGSCQEIPFDTKGDNYNQNGEQMDNKNEQWFGATVSASGRESGPVVACAPRYTWYPRRKTRRDPVGTCWVSNGRFNNFDEYSPCRTFQWGYHRQGSCQAGFSAGINSIGDRLFIGAPGSWFWQGQLYSIDAHAKFDFKPPLFSGTYGAAGQVHQQGLESRPAVFSTVEGSKNNDDSYMGYSLTVGDFLANGEEGIAVGMPKGNDHKGKVLIFTWNLTDVYHHFTSDQIGSYYGYALAASDVDGDKKLDLIIGAPMYTKSNNEGKYDVGRVYVIYHESKMGKYTATYVIDGFNSKSRFGQALCSLGDINQDGYGDFAVGAPYDGPKERGAVYIYHGSKKGVRTTYSQVIYAEDVVPGPTGALATFGFSLNGGLDLDGNQYPDMVVGAYLSNSAFVFRSRPVVGVQASVRFLAPKKEVDIKVTNYKLASGAYATVTDIEFCLKYHGKGIPQFIDLDLQYILDTKKPKNPRMGFVDNQNVNTLNDTIRIFKDKDETCKRKQVFVKSDIKDKLTSLEAEMRYWMREDSGSVVYERTRNPRSELKPILDLNSPPSRKDSINVHKDCGDDNICIPNLKLEVTSNVDQYLLDQYEQDSRRRTPLIFTVLVSNTGEDSFGTTLDVKYPENVYFRSVKDLKVESHVVCDPYENQTLKCDIGNPIPRGKIVKFEINWQPDLNEDMPPFYSFYMRVNSTNEELGHDLWDNTFNVTVQLWSQARIEVSGSSAPPEVFWNTSLYKEEISHQTQYTPFDDRLTEDVIGPRVTHYYYLRNIGPVTVKEAEVYFIWPEKTLTGEDLVYLLEPPRFRPEDNVECDLIGANYRGFNLDLTLSKQIWDRFGVETSTATSTDTGSVGSVVGGGTAKPDKAIDEKVGDSGGDGSLVHEERQRNETKTQTKNTTIWNGGMIDQTHTKNTIFTNASGSYLVSSSGQFIRKTDAAYRCYDVVDGDLKEISCRPDVTYRYYRQTNAGGSPQDLTLVSQCYKTTNGVRYPLECQSEIKSSNRIYQYYQQGRIDQLQSQSFVWQKCYEIINGVKQEVPCSPGVTIGNVTYKCFEQLNGRLNEIRCKSGLTYQYFQKTASSFNLVEGCYQESLGNKRPVECGSEFQRGHITYTLTNEQNVMHVCYDTMNGQRIQVDCGSSASSGQQIATGGQNTGKLKYFCYEQINGQLKLILCQPGIYNYFRQEPNGLALISGCFSEAHGSKKRIECGPEFQKGQITYTSSQQNVMINTVGGSGTTYRCFEEVNSQLIEIPCKSGTYHYFQQTQHGLNLISGCFNEINGARQPIECGSDFTKGQITYTWFQQTSNSEHKVAGENASYICFNYINDRLHEIPCRTGTYEFVQQVQGGNLNSLNLIEGCYNEINGVRQPIDCSRFFERRTVTYYEQQINSGGTTSTNINLVEKCYDLINGVKLEVPCSFKYFQQGNITTNLHHKCFDIINGLKIEVPCIPGGTLPPVQQWQGGKLQVNGETIIYRCYESVDGRSVQTDCSTAAAQGKNVTHQCFKEVKNALRPIPCGLGFQLPQQVYHSQRQQQSHQRVTGGGESSTSWQQQNRSNQELSTTSQQQLQHGQQHVSSGVGFQRNYSQQHGQQFGTQYAQQGNADDRRNEVGRSQYHGQGHESSVHQSQHGQFGQQSGSQQYGQQHASGFQNNYSQHGQFGTQFSQQQHGQSRSEGTHQQETSSISNNNNEEEYEEYEYEDYDEEEGGKTITGYQDTGSNHVSTGSVSNLDAHQQTSSRRDPSTYGGQVDLGGISRNGLEDAVRNKGFTVTTVDVSNLGSRGRGASSSNVRGGVESLARHPAGGGSGYIHQPSRGGANTRTYTEERSWEVTQDLPPNAYNTIERDNVPTDRPMKNQRYYGRKKRDVQRIAEVYPCPAAQCKYMTCRISNLRKDSVVEIAIRGRINARVLRNITVTTSTSQPISLSSVMAARITKLPIISDLPQEQYLEWHEVNTTIPVKSLEPSKSDLVPMWVVVLSAVAGTIILLLLIFLLYKIGFFKRNRPSSAPERQPLNRNGYNQGDEAL